MRSCSALHNQSGRRAGPSQHYPQVTGKASPPGLITPCAPRLLCLLPGPGPPWRQKFGSSGLPRARSSLYHRTVPVVPVSISATQLLMKTSLLIFKIFKLIINVFLSFIQDFFLPNYLYKMLCYTLRDLNQLRDLDSYNKQVST